MYKKIGILLVLLFIVLLRLNAFAEEGMVSGGQESLENRYYVSRTGIANFLKGRDPASIYSWDISLLDFKGAENIYCGGKGVCEKDPKNDAIIGLRDKGRLFGQGESLYLEARFEGSEELENFFGGEHNWFPIYRFEVGKNKDGKTVIRIYERELNYIFEKWQDLPHSEEDKFMHVAWVPVETIVVRTKYLTGIQCAFEKRIGFQASREKELVMGEEKGVLVEGVRIYSVGFVGEEQDGKVEMGMSNWLDFVEKAKGWNLNNLRIKQITQKTLTANEEKLLKYTDFDRHYVRLKNNNDLNIVVKNVLETQGEEKTLYLIFGNRDSLIGKTTAKLEQMYWKETNPNPLGYANLDFCEDFELDGSKVLELDYNAVKGRMVRVCLKKGTLSEEEFLFRLTNWNGKRLALTLVQSSGENEDNFKSKEVYERIFESKTKNAVSRKLQLEKDSLEGVPETKFGWYWSDIEMDTCSEYYCDASQFTTALFKRLNYIKENRKNLEEEKIQDLADFPVFLAKDGFPEDFSNDFKKAMGQLLADTPTWFTDADAFNQYLGKNLEFDDSELDGPGLYETVVSFELNESGSGEFLADDFKEDFFSQGKPSGKIFVKFNKIRDPVRDYPMLHIPIDGMLGQDGHRQSYGSLVREGEPLVVYKDISKGEFIILPKQAPGAEPIEFVDSKQINDPGKPAISISEISSYEITMNSSYINTMSDAFSGETIEFSEVSHEEIVSEIVETETQPDDTEKQPPTTESDTDNGTTHPRKTFQMPEIDFFIGAIGIITAVVAVFEVFAFRSSRKRLLERNRK